MGPLLLVGFAESLSAPEVVFSLLNAGYRLRMFARKGRTSRLARTVGAEIVEITAPETDIAAAQQDLVAACKGVDGIFALDDVSLRLCADIAGQTPDIRHIHATGDSAEVALNKETQLRVARAAGLSVPDGLILHTPADLPQSHPVPAIVKPMHAVETVQGRITKGDVHYLMTREDVQNLREADALPGPLIVQPLIHGVGEGVFGHATPTGVVQWSGHRRLRMMNPHGSGSSACEVLEPDPVLRGKIEQLMRDLAWRGPFMIELLRDAQGTAWFMELNGRVWGSMALARRNGLDYPAWAAASAWEPDFQPQRGPQRRQSVRHLGREILHLLFLVKGPKTAFHRANWPRLSQSLLGVFRPGKAAGFYNYDPAHRFFFLADAWDTVASALKRRR